MSSRTPPLLPNQGKFRPEATRNLYCTFATLSVLLREVARESKQYGMIHLIPNLKHYRNKLPKKFSQHEIINHYINRQ